MPHHHAVLWIDHHTAQLLQFDATQVIEQQVKAHVHYTRQHGSKVRSEHEFFGEVCDALEGIAQVLVAGSHTAQADFRHYVEKHRAEVALRLAGWETTQHMSANELVAFARRYFTLHAGMATPMKAA
ncbi:hypothetical protein ACSFBX_22620 [Variovorax sp. RB2P76]|jgi:stalled ribosome rescue protein Dom34|uniref:hypothetical protein n=1 Tax=Variovorax sp. RB2P76 TaxID=3443736 RepID=UPI003F48C67D